MTIPEIRRRLLLVADMITTGKITPLGAARRIRLLERQMYRRPAVRRASDRNKPLTPQQIAMVQDLASSDLTMAQIAQKAGIPNPGRVSEILAGKRT